MAVCSGVYMLLKLKKNNHWQILTIECNYIFVLKTTVLPVHFHWPVLVQNEILVWRWNTVCHDFSEGLDTPDNTCQLCCCYNEQRITKHSVFRVYLWFLENNYSLHHELETQIFFWLMFKVARSSCYFQLPMHV